jgi:hypothetical protein
MLRSRFQFIHGEDYAIGLQVQNPAGGSWECHDNRRALYEVASENLRRCVAAVQASADEIHTSYLKKEAPSTYAAWRIAPTLESVRSTSQALAELFTFDWEGRQDINHHITVDSTHTIIPRSGISAVIPTPWSLRVFYQMLDGTIFQSVHSSGQWTHDQPVISALPFTPLASLSWNDGKEVSGLNTPGTWPDEDLGRFACTTSTTSTYSKSIVTLNVEVGLQGISAK